EEESTVSAPTANARTPRSVVWLGVGSMRFVGVEVNRPSSPAGFSSSTFHASYPLPESFPPSARYTSRHVPFSMSHVLTSPWPVPPATTTHFPRPLDGCKASLWISVEPGRPHALRRRRNRRSHRLRIPWV